MKTTTFARRLALLAGALDLCTGIGLTFLPRLTLELMLVPVPDRQALVYLRFIGAFVASVGASYLWALARPVERLRVIFGSTLLFRSFVGSFCLVAVITGQLPPAWLTVAITDLGLAATQGWLLRSPD